jgi:hypothetical protein
MKDKEKERESAPLTRAFRLSISKRFQKMMLRENRSKANGLTSYPFFNLRSSRSSVVKSLILQP